MAIFMQIKYILSCSKWNKITFDALLPIKFYGLMYTYYTPQIMVTNIVMLVKMTKMTLIFFPNTI